VRGRGALRGAVAAWLGLITLEAIVSKGGSGKIAGAFTAVDGVVEHLLDPKVPLLPDHSKPASSAAAGSVAGIDPNSPTAAAQLAAQQGAQAAAGAGAVTAVTSPGGLLYNLPALTAYTNGAGPAKNQR
jgi:hypothetical protein